jgi:dehydration protein DpgD
MEALETVVYEKRGRVAYVTLNRPTTSNAMNTRMHEELRYVWDDFEADCQILVGVLTGAGSSAFSSGQDLQELKEKYLAGHKASSLGSLGGPGSPRLTERLNMSKPLIARVNGMAVGGGFELALSCDLIVAAEHAKFSLPEAKLGLIPGAGGLFRLTRQIPSRTALGYLMTGREMPAARAFELGLVNEVAPFDTLDACVGAWVDDVLRCSPLSLRSIKSVVASSSHLPLEEAFYMHYPAEDFRIAGNDCREGPLAFTEKRPPKWTDS